MNADLRVFTRKLLILASIVGILIIAVILLMQPRHVTPTLPYLLVFHAGATLLSYMVIQKKVKDTPTKFVNVYLGSTTVKLLLYLGVLMTYALMNLSDAVNFIISFFVLYVIFTVFEVIQLTRLMK